MAYGIEINPHDTRPIWRQIEESFHRLVAASVLSPGARVPSVRELASDLRINPATVSKAYQGLVAKGVFEVRRGEGTFAADSPPRLSDSDIASLLGEEARRLTAVALTVGAERADVDRVVEEAWVRAMGARAEVKKDE